MAFVDLELVAKVVGWVFFIGPIAAVLGVSVNLILGAAKDDDMIRGIVMMGSSIFLLGAGMLAIAYFTDLIPQIA